MVYILFLKFDPRIVAFLHHVTVRHEPTFLRIYYTIFKPLTCQICGYIYRKYIQYIK